MSTYINGRIQEALRAVITLQSFLLAWNDSDLNDDTATTSLVNTLKETDRVIKRIVKESK